MLRTFLLESCLRLGVVEDGTKGGFVEANIAFLFNGAFFFPVISLRGVVDDELLDMIPSFI